MSPTRRLLGASDLETIKEVRPEKRTDGVVLMEVSGVVGLMFIAVWVMACISIAVDTTLGIISLNEGVANQMGLPYNETTDSWELSNIEWTPLAILEFKQNGSGIVPPMTTDLIFTSTWKTGGAPVIVNSIESYSCSDGCEPVSIQISGGSMFRKGWRIPFGKKISVSVRIAAITVLPHLPIEQEWKNGATLRMNVLSDAYVNTSTYLGVFLFLLTSIMLIYYLYRCHFSASEITSDQKLVAVLLVLFMFHVPAIVTLDAALEFRSEHKYIDIILTVLPYLFVHCLWGTVWGVIYQQRPSWSSGSRTPYTRCMFWTVFATALTIVYALSAEDDQYTDISTGWWDLVTGNSHDELFQKLIAGTYGGTTILVLIVLIIAVKRARKSFRHAPYLVFRGKMLKSKLFSAVAVSCIFHEIGSTGSFLLMTSPLVSTSMGSCAFFFSVMMGLASCMLPAYKINDTSKPPPPTMRWKDVVWPFEWRRWASKNKSAASVYFFYYAKEENDFWVLQSEAAAKEDTVSVDNAPVICTADRDFDDVFFKAIKLMYSLLSSARNTAVFMLLWPCSLFAACFCWCAPLQYTQHLTLLLFNNGVVNLFSIPPLRHPHGLPALDEEMFGFTKNWHKILYIFGVLVYTPFSCYLMFCPVTVAWVISPFGVFLRWCALTYPVGTLLLAVEEAVADFFIRLHQELVRVMFLTHATWDETPIGNTGNREFWFHPFCIETCAMLTSMSYEAYRSCPLINEPVDNSSQIGPLNVGGLLRSGLVSANAIGGRQGGNRDIDLLRHGITLLNVTVVSGVQILFATDSCRRKLIISFRGTSNTANKVADLDFMRERWSEMSDLGPRFSDQSAISRWQCGSCTSYPLVHRGFSRLWDNIREAVQRETAIHMNTGIPRICVTGHSLGASLAVLCSYSLAKVYGSNNVLLYSFGTPLLGNSAFARAMKKAVPHNMNVVHENDACTRAAGTWGNYHAGNSVRIGRCGQVLINPLRIELSLHPWGGGGNPFSAHKLVKHQSSLSVAAALHGVTITTRVGEENMTTDRISWTLGPTNGRYPVGSEVIYTAYNQAGQAEYFFARVAGYRGKTIRLRTTRGPVDVPYNVVSKPQEGLHKSAIKTYPFPTNVTTTYVPCDMRSYKQKAVNMSHESMTLLNHLEPSAPPAESVLRVPQSESVGYGSAVVPNVIAAGQPLEQQESHDTLIVAPSSASDGSEGVLM